MNNDETIRNNIINLRESENMSQSELGRRTHLDNSVISKIEKGTRRVSADELKKFSNVFGVSTDYLLGNNNSIKDDNIDITNGLEGHTLMTYQGKPIPDEDMELIKRILKGKE